MSVKVRYSDELYHYGIEGMKWGIRRYQNEDGSLTTAGKLRYRIASKVPEDVRQRKALRKQINKENRKAKYLVDQAAFYGGYSKRGNQLVAEALKRYNKKPTDNNKLDLEAARAILDIGNTRREKVTSLINDHYDSLLDKYGDIPIKPIKYDKDGYIKQPLTRQIPREIARGKGGLGGAIGGAISGALDAYEYKKTGTPPSTSLTKNMGKFYARGDYNEYREALRDLDRAKKLRAKGKERRANSLEEEANNRIAPYVRMKNPK